MGMNLCHYIDTHQSLFQPTPLQWGELPFAVACVGNPKFQPTSPCGDEQTILLSGYIAPNITTHTPRMGMNFYVYHSPCTSFITTHTPVWG